LAKINRRTLKKRINRSVYMASVISILLFSITLLIVMSSLLKPISVFTSNLISDSVAREMNSETFLREHKLGTLEQFDPRSPLAAEWLQSMNRLSKLTQYLDLEDSQKLDEHFSTTTHPTGISLNQDFNFIQLKIEIGNRSIYIGTEQMFELDSPFLEQLVRIYTNEAVSPLLNQDGTEIGRVSVMFSPEFTLTICILLVGGFIILILIALLISKFIGKLISNPVLKPLDHLITRMNEISLATSAMDSKIELKKPLREIESLAEATHMIMNKMKDYNEKVEQQKDVLEEQNEELEAQNEELTHSKLMLQEAQHQLIRSGKSIRNLLDNAGQGFLTFSETLLVDPEYSLECSHIFEKEIEGVSFPALLSEGDEEQQRFLENLLQKLFSEKDKLKRSIYFPLLTEEIELNHRFIKLEYKMIQSTDVTDEESIMVILTDVTEKHELQSQMEKERNILTMVVKVIINYGDFMDCARNFRLFYELELPELLHGDDTVRSKLLSVFRDVHTYKGNFAQFGLTHIVRRLHEAESELSRLMRIADTLEQADLLTCVKALDVNTWLDEDMEILESVMGSAFFKQEELLLIDKTKLLEIERKMLSILSPNECKLLLPDLRKLRYKPFRDLFKAYPEYVTGLAERMEKVVNPIVITGGEFMADTETYYDFSRSLIHVFRNIIDHGVETVDDRIAAGKEEAATVSCHMELKDGSMIIELSDDGAGMNPEIIRKRAAEKGILAEHLLQELSDKSVIELIFHDEFSTKEVISELSGRGIGLSSVKAEVEKLGGAVEVRTESGKGTTFLFRLPYEELTSVPRIEYPESLNATIKMTKGYLEQFAKVSMETDNSFICSTTDKLTLKKVTSFVAMKGAVEGFFVMSVDEALSRDMVRGVVIEPLTSEEVEDLVEDTLAETSNIILGNSLKIFQQFSEYMLMEPPITIYTEGASIKYADSEIWTCELYGEQGTMQISFVIMKRG
jgi:two-component system chemotaxis sensor kinase CheA